MWMQRALDLATRGWRTVAPNPMVGCVLVNADGKFLAEGWHQRPGGPHAEIDAIDAIPEDRLSELQGATCYVSLEPCSHQGRTPPCANRLVQARVARVVIAARDPNPQVNGAGIQLLRNAGIQVEVGLLGAISQEINARFYTNVLEQRPWIQLKWAQSADGYMDPRPPGHLDIQPGGIAISAPWSQLLTHQMRSSFHSILVGRRTAELDLPQLTNRHAPGESPQKWVIDSDCRMPTDHPFFQQGGRRMPLGGLNSLWTNHQMHSLMIEGGRETLERWMKEKPVDEIIIFEHPAKKLGSGLPAPAIPKSFSLERKIQLQNNFVKYMRNPYSFYGK